MKNIENYLPMSAEKLIQEMGSFGNGKPTLDKALAAVPELPRLLTAPLEMILEEFNYRDNKNSRIAIACRVLAVLISALAPLEELKEEAGPDAGKEKKKPR